MKKILIFLFILYQANSLLFASSANDCQYTNNPNTQDEYQVCLKVDIAKNAKDAGVDCIDCLFAAQQQQQPSDWVQALSVVAQPLAYFGAAYFSAKFQNESQQAWASAYSSAASQCTNQFNSYLNYATSTGANPVTASNAQSLMNSCNSSSYGSYAGFGGLASTGFGGIGNPWLSQGYSQGFMSGMVGPYYGGGMAQMGMTSGVYGMNNNMYGGAGLGLYGNIGIGAQSYGLNYGQNYGAYPGYNMNGMGYAGMGINPLYSGQGNFGTSTYNTGSLTSTIGFNPNTNTTPTNVPTTGYRF